VIEHRIVVALARAPLFADLPRRDVARVAAFCRYVDFRKNNIVFVQGAPAASFYVVAAGYIKVSKGSAEGKELIIKVMRPGDLVGEAAAVLGRPYPASAQALTDAAAVEVPRRDFIALVKSEPPLALNMLGALSIRLNQLSAVLEQLTLKEVPARLATHLLTHATYGPGGEPPVVELAIPKHALAAELGTAPETLSRALRKFADAGFIRLDDRRIILADEDSLRRLADGPATAT